MPDFVGPDFSPTPQTQSVEQITSPIVPPDVIGAIGPVDPGILPPGPSPAITYDQANGNPYSEAFLDSRYDTDMGLLAVPVAGTGPQCEIIQVHQPIATRIFEWTLERVGQAPVAPSWLTNNPNEVLIEMTISPASSAMGADGTLLRRRSGRYVYQLLQPPGAQDQLFEGVPPYMAIAPSAMNVQPYEFDTNLSDTSSTVPQGFVPPDGLQGVANG